MRMYSVIESWSRGSDIAAEDEPRNFSCRRRRFGSLFWLRRFCPLRFKLPRDGADSRCPCQSRQLIYFCDQVRILRQMHKDRFRVAGFFTDRLNDVRCHTASSLHVPDHLPGELFHDPTRGLIGRQVYRIRMLYGLLRGLVQPREILRDLRNPFCYCGRR